MKERDFEKSDYQDVESKYPQAFSEFPVVAIVSQPPLLPPHFLGVPHRDLCKGNKFRKCICIFIVN